MSLQSEIAKVTGHEAVTEVLNILAGFVGFEREWYEHVVEERWGSRSGCKCRMLGGDRQEECTKWLAIKRVKDAEQNLERAKQALESAKRNLDAE